ncbi:PREDICTED: WD repeat-containing protein 74-like [Ipomoea nil]|uniref:WD repeat-containing protein 74-like n=1 Tax=Ipomoea nil TaxID=35883 RepID=UPI000900BF69|nr:PREDICTED: WD repeat-containing protein 74-like [Ipomoea nil]
MPRTITAESPGCPRLRALTFDVLGLIKVIEARGGEQKEAPAVVERWGAPDSSRCVLATSMIDREHDPLLGVARKNGMIEVLSPINGDVRLAIPSSSGSGSVSDDDAIVALHLFSKQRLESSLLSCTLLDCTTKGHASIRSAEIPKPLGDSVTESSQTIWNVCGSGNILCSKVDSNEHYALFAGKGVEINVWDLEQSSKIWVSKSPPKNSLGIFTPTWFTSATFLSKDDHRKIIAGTNNHEVRLYDISYQRRPVISIDFREAPIKAVAEDLDGWTVYVGNGSSDLASFDMRTGKLLGSFLGKCSGSIRSIARHPELPVIGSCGLDSYLRIWDVKSRQLLSAVFLKQHLTNVVFDSHFNNEAPLPQEPQDVSETQEECEEETTMATKRKKASKDHSRKKKVKTNKTARQDPEQQDVSEMSASHSEDHENWLNDEAEEETTPPRKEKVSKRHSGKKKRRQRVVISIS